MYQGRWDAAFRDMESGIILMRKDQGMAIVSWVLLGGWQLFAAEQREKMEEDPNSGKGYYGALEDDIKVYGVLERLAKKKDTTLKASISLRSGMDMLTPTKIIRRSHISSISQRIFLSSSVYIPSSM
jgi:aryl-alcohol dehydrogenase-like predicted oxidoreductase